MYSKTLVQPSSIFLCIMYVLAPPTLLVEDTVVTKAALLGNQTSIVFGIFSRTSLGVNITRTNVTHEMMEFSSDITPARVNLPVFDQLVETDGFQCIINFTVKSEKEFGEYQLSVTNSEGTFTHSLEVVPEGTFG